MKAVGLFFLLIGLALLGMAAYYYFGASNVEISPLPQDNGVKVIFITPTP